MNPRITRAQTGDIIPDSIRITNQAKVLAREEARRAKAEEKKRKMEEQREAQAQKKAAKKAERESEIKERKGSAMDSRQRAQHASYCRRMKAWGFDPS